jgi:hypothetical protein
MIRSFLSNSKPSIRADKLQKENDALSPLRPKPKGALSNYVGTARRSRPTFNPPRPHQPSLA